MELQAILDAMAANPELVKGVLPTVVDSEVGKTLIATRAENLYKSKIDDEVKAIHSQYDDDVFAILGKRPGSKDGVKQKSYDFIKELLTDYKGLLEQKDSLDKDTKVAALQLEIDKLKTEGGGKHIQEIFDQAKSDWENEKASLIKDRDDAKNMSIDFQKKTAIGNAVRQLKFNPDVSESIRQMVLDNAEQQLISNSEFQDGKLVFRDNEGKPILDKTTHSPLDAFGVISQMQAVKDISLIDDKKPGGGGADVTIKGNIQTTSVEGKDTKSLILPEGSFKTRSEFLNVSEKALIDAGITRRMPEWDELKNAAYAEYKVAELPV